MCTTQLKMIFNGSWIFIYFFYCFPGCSFQATLLWPSCTLLETWKETARKQIEQAGLILRVLPLQEILEKKYALNFSIYEIRWSAAQWANEDRVSQPKSAQIGSQIFTETVVFGARTK